MFKIGKILSRSWEILWNYKVLWIFAFLMALTGAGPHGGGGSGGGSGANLRFGDTSQRNLFPNGFSTQPWLPDLETWFRANVYPLFATEAKAITTVLLVVGGLILLGIIIGLLFALVRYPAETAVIRMVDEHEQTGTRYSFKQGWKLGWNRRAFRLWLIDLLLGVPAFVLVLGLLGLVFWAVWNNGFAFMPARAAGLVVAFICLAMPFALVMVFLGLLRNFFVRAAALDEISLGEAFKRGWMVFTHNWKEALLTWLVMLAIGIGVGLAMVFVVIILIPLYAILAIPGAVVAAIPGGIAYGITSLINPLVWPWIIGALVAIPFFFMVVFAPVIFLGGLAMLFDLNVWTLAYRQMRTMTMVAPALPVVPPPAPQD